jgi:hypothetical protein
VHIFAIDTMRGAGSGTAELVDADPGQNLIVGPGIAVGPVVEFLVDPGEQGEGDGRVLEMVWGLVDWRTL